MVKNLYQVTSDEKLPKQYLNYWNLVKKMGLCVNQEETKFMVLSRSNENQPNLQVDNLTFEKVENFKYLGVNINNKNDMHREISERIASRNQYYHGISKLLKSRLLSRKSKL